MIAVGFFENSAAIPDKPITNPMKNKRLNRLSAPTAAGFIFALSAIHSHAAITLGVTTGGTSAISSATTTFTLDGSGNVLAAPSGSGLTASGSVTPTLSFGTSFDFTIDAVRVVDTTVGASYGSKSTNGNINRASTGELGVTGTGSIGNGIDLNEGLLLGIDASGLNPALAWKLTGIQLRFVDQPNEIYTIVNRNNTSLSITGTTPTNANTMIDVSSLGIMVQGGTSDLDLATVFMSSNSASTQNFRVSGFQLDAIPEPNAALLGGLGLLALLRRQRAC
jgi:hypothetical protein